MSVAQLEQFVSFIVKRSCRKGENDVVNARPIWWPNEIAFSYPIERTRTMDVGKWREILLDIVSRCYTYRDRRRRRRTRENRSKLKNYMSPVVNLCDVLTLRKNEEQGQFLTYFGLGNKETVIEKNVKKNYKPPSHPMHLLNTHQVPFSSVLGQKMTKDCHIVTQETHQRKLERTERYLNANSLPESATKDVRYEITYHKNIRNLRTYRFPTKSYHDPDRLSRKAQFLLKHLCKPCEIKLTNVDSHPKNPTFRKRLAEVNHNVPFVKINRIRWPPKKTTRVTRSKNGSKNVTPLKENTTPVSFARAVLPRIGNENLVLVPNTNRNTFNNDLCSVMLTPINFTKNKRHKTKSGFDDNKVKKRRVFVQKPRRFSLRVFRLKYVKDT